MKNEIVIDAKGKKIGRLASEIAKTLRGKTEADFAPNRTMFPKVIVKNVDMVSFSENKLKNTFFQRYSGYPGGRKVFSAFEIAEKDVREVLKHAVLGMIRKNTLKKRMIKNLTLLHGEDK